MISTRNLGEVIACRQFISQTRPFTADEQIEFHEMNVLPEDDVSLGFVLIVTVSGLIEWR